MMITVDNLAQRYGFLPSEIMEKASTYDLQVLNVSSKYDAYLRKKENDDPEDQELTQEDMLGMIQNVKDQECQKLKTL